MSTRLLQRFTVSDRKSLESLFHLAHSLKRQMHDHIEEMELDIAPMHVRGF